MRRRWAIGVIAAALAIGLLAAACGGDEGDKSGATAAGAGGNKTAQVALDDFYFKPTALQGQTGQPIQLKLTNEGKETHTFTIDSLNIDKTLKPGEEATITVTPSQAGGLTYYCRFHVQSSNMKGTLTVSGAAGVAPPKTTAAASAPPKSPGGSSGYYGGY